jgi:hypothetical protein
MGIHHAEDGPGAVLYRCKSIVWIDGCPWMHYQQGSVMLSCLAHVSNS